MESFWSTPLARTLFTPPDTPHTLWREQPFDVLVGDRWISGIFDRVVLLENEAEILDFKTDEKADGKLYHDQLNQYRQALATLTGRDPGTIRASLVFLPGGKKIPVPPEDQTAD